MTTMGERFSEEEVDEIIREVDKDGDEQVGKSQASTQLTQIFQIDLDEFVNMVAPIVSDGTKTDPFAEPAASSNPTTAKWTFGSLSVHNHFFPCLSLAP